MEETIQSRKKVLVVDDEPGYQELISTILGSTYALHLCESAEEAQEALAQGNFDVVVLDINLLGMTGLSFLEKMRGDERLRDLPVVLCSSQTDPDTRTKAMELGAAGFVEKPFQVELLLRMLKALTG